ncbi:hypothetical protein SFRURICE_003263 [Spodoptera frugiperda]|uniref:SFRICE_017151 n=1 Tax=Spodoptera frugiperda TaxID=7108 RepID=A0A2H1W2Q7_SPOFR|nr:hypothetical protein SFRURICE_003263 [Spodoptera frugiperda]
MTTVAVCPAWAEHRRVLGDAVSSFCEAVMLATEEAGRLRERTSSCTRDTPSQETLRASGIAQQSPATPTAVAVPGAGSGCSGNYEGRRSLRIMLCSCAYLVNDVLGLGSHVVNDGATLACS